MTVLFLLACGSGGPVQMPNPPPEWPIASRPVAGAAAPVEVPVTPAEPVAPAEPVDADTDAPVEVPLTP